MINCRLIRWLDEAKTQWETVYESVDIDNEAIVGLNPMLQYLVNRTPFLKPDYDVRRFSLLTTKSIGEGLDSEYTSLGVFETKYELIPRSKEQLKVCVDEVKNINNLKVFPQCEVDEHIIMCVALLEKKFNGGSISTAQQGMIDKVTARSVNIYTNIQIADSKKEAIDAGNEVDLDTDFISIDPS